MSHTFHIPVLGLSFSIDTPVKVARYGISSVISIVDDELIERMREFYLKQVNKVYAAIKKTEDDHRAKRITAYLDLVSDLVDEQFETLKNLPFLPGTDLSKYFDLLPDTSASKILYLQMLDEKNEDQKLSYQEHLRTLITKGSIDVNLMSKVDRINYDKNGNSFGDQFSDALAALRGFAKSKLNSSLVLSAGMNPRLYSYLEEFPDFFPSGDESALKKVILKVSDFRSASIQAKFLAKKGIWIHEFRIESGLNCGGHAFATEGLLLGPILEEFKQKRAELVQELSEIYSKALNAKGISGLKIPATRITVQGGIGTFLEDDFLQKYYNLDGTGWGSPFLLVPEATNVDADTLQLLAGAGKEDFYISGASPLGIPFNNFRKSTAETQRLERIAKGKPGSPCTKKFLVSNTEFTAIPICTASREYQNLKLKELKSRMISEEKYQQEYNLITEKTCLCQGLATAVYIKNDILKSRENNAVAICPGPNTGYFSKIYSLENMVKNIYGKLNLLEGVERPHVFVNELSLYVSYLKKDIEMNIKTLTDKKVKQLIRFKEQLLIGVDYYATLVPELKKNSTAFNDRFINDLEQIKQLVNRINFPAPLLPK
ncbi:hypothetical protein [Daejeonella oryzae]|uniref:hypothetical protein n=1 Tax=Daejeonella oryzae TaxID=1122943 RepID=UPI0004023BB4|nr:hypothetical protein [Daejeonella oryzae]